MTAGMLPAVLAFLVALPLLLIADAAIGEPDAQRGPVRLVATVALAAALPLIGAAQLVRLAASLLAPIPAPAFAWSPA